MGGRACGHTVVGGIARVLLGAGVVLAVLVLWAIGSSNQQDQAWRSSQALAAAAAARVDSIRAHDAHAAWCVEWAGRPVADSVCRQWWVDTAPPRELGLAVATHVRQRRRDSLTADRELRAIDRSLGAGTLGVEDIFPTWNQWAETHRRADRFGRVRALGLVGVACRTRVPVHGDYALESKRLEGQIDWCYHSESIDSAIFARAAP